MFDAEERTVYGVRMHALMEVESKIALNLLAQGMAIENVAKVTELTEDFLKTL
jgi:hypothetical protein